MTLEKRINLVSHTQYDIRESCLNGELTLTAMQPVEIGIVVPIIPSDDLKTKAMELYDREWRTVMCGDIYYVTNNCVVQFNIPCEIGKMEDRWKMWEYYSFEQLEKK